MSWNEDIKKELGYVGTNVKIGYNTIFTNPKNVILHDNVRIDPFGLITTALEVDNYCQICSHVVLGGGAQHKIKLGKWCFIGYGSKLFCGSEDYSGEFGPVNDYWGSNKVKHGDITFEDYSGIASDVIVMPNVILPEGCTVGAKSLVYRTPEKEWSIYLGTPLKFHKDRNKEKCIQLASDPTFLKYRPKCCKVIATYFGARRARNNNTPTPGECLEQFKKIVEIEKRLDPGEDCDIIIVNNQAGFHEANLFIDSLEGVEAKRGRFRVFTRENTGASFACYNYAWQTLKDEYDYFFFVEDDVITTKEGYYSKFIEELNGDANNGFVALSPIVNSHGGYHCGGGCGMTSKVILEKVATLNNGDLPYNTMTTYDGWVATEVAFTSVYSLLNLKVVNVKSFSPFAENWITHQSQAERHHQLAINDSDLEFVYRVGL